MPNFEPQESMNLTTERTELPQYALNLTQARFTRSTRAGHVPPFAASSAAPNPAISYPNTPHTTLAVPG